MSTLLQDLRYALRMLRKNPAVTTVSILTLALGIGANTAIFSLINAVMLKALPVKDPNQLVVVGDPSQPHRRSNGTPSVELFSYPLYRELRDANNVFSGMLASGEVHRLKVETGNSGLVTSDALGVLVSGNYFSVMGVNTLLGRTLNPDDDGAPTGHPVAVISYGFWRDKLGQDPGIVGQTARLNNYPFTIVGVAPPGFFGDTVGDQQDLWIPVTMQSQIIPGRAWMENFGASWLHIIARLKPGTTISEARANVNVAFQRLVSSSILAKLDSDDRDELRKAQIDVTAGGGGFSDLRSSFRQPLFLLMGIVGMVLLVACVNVANLLLARASARQKEIAVRLAIGAARGRIIRQLLTESVLLAFTGGAFGILVAQWGTRALLHMSGQADLDAHPDLRVLAFTGAVCLLTGVLFGLVPAFRTLKVEVTPVLKNNAQGNGSPGASPWGWGKILVSAQVMLSLLVLLTAGLLVRSMQNLKNLDLGYGRENLLMVGVDRRTAGYQTAAQLVGLSDQLVARFSALPGVRGAAASKSGLFSGSQSAESIKIEGLAPRQDTDMVAGFDWVGPDFFKVLGVPTLLGREIGPQDTPSSTGVAVINQSMARFYFGATNPIGRKILMDQDQRKNVPFEIIGVVPDLRDQSLRGKVERKCYVPIAQAPDDMGGGLNFMIKTAGNPAAVADSVRKEIKNFDANLPVERVRALESLVNNSMSNDVLLAKLSSFFGLLALMLACVGLYGVMSYTVARKTGEIGVRMALGAQRANILWMILREVIILVLIGVAVGVPGALAGSHLFAAMLFGLKNIDPLSMSLVVLLMVIVAMLAGFIPARRATKVDPMRALRYE
jgi:predicted permease